MTRRCVNASGQFLLEYSILLAAVALAITFAARFAQRAFTAHAQAIEREGVIF